MTARQLSVGVALLGVLAAAGCADPEEPLAPWAWAMPRCVAYQPERYETPARRVEVEQIREGVVSEVYESGWGPDAFAEIRSVVHTCGSFEDGDLREQNLIVQTGFGGDESVLVETVRIEHGGGGGQAGATPPAMRTVYAAVVREGDAIVTVRVPGLGREETLCLAGAERATCRTGQA